MISIKFICLSCKSIKNKEIDKWDSYNNQRTTEVDGPHIVCDECQEIERIEIRNRKIKKILEKKWWQF